MSTEGCTVWLTGLSGAGKTTLAHLLSDQLKNLGRRVEVLDGDVVREVISPDLGFSKQDRDHHNQRLAYIAELLSRNGVIVIVSAISPYRETRQKIRKRLGRFLEIFIDCPISTCEQRDVKGLYKKARNHQTPQFTGLDDPYEEPLNPELVIHSADESKERSLERLLNFLTHHPFFRDSL